MENSEKSSSPAPSTSAAGGKEKIEKQARQLAYDTRYKVKQSMAANKGGKLDPAAVRKAYIAQLGKSPSSPPVKARAKEMLVGEEYINTDQLVHKSAVSVLEKVFSEKYKGNPKSKPKKPEGGDRRPGVGCEDIKEDSGEKTYKVRVTDKKTNNTYVRMATRAKISELRANPNISSVEMTGYGSPTKSEKYKGKQTAAVKAGKDYDGDGKIESPTAEYKGSKDKAIKKALRSENFDGFLELVEYKKDKKKSKITGEGVNNKKLIKVFPDDVEEQVDTAQKDIESKQKKQSQLKKQVLQKKLQAVRQGGGEDITASYQPEGEVTEGNQRDPENLKKDRTRSKQPDPSKSGFTGIGNMSIADIKKMNARMKKEEVENLDELKSTTLLSYSNKAANELAFKGDGSKKAQKRATGVKRAAGQLTMKAINKEEVEVETDLQNEDAEYGYDKDGNSLNPKDIKKKNEKDPNGEAKKQEEEDPRGMATKINLVRNKLRAMGLNMSQEPEGETIEESEKVAAGALKRAQKLGAARRKREGVNRGMGKNERAGYKLSQAARSSDSSLETQRTKKKQPAGTDTSQIGHYKKRDEKVTVGKRGKPLKQARYKLSLSQRVDHHSNKAWERRDPKKNPKHTANESVQSALDVLDIFIEAKKKGLDGKVCWDGYKLAGTKKKGGKTVDNCVKVEHHQKDANGKVIEHGDGTPSSVEEEKKPKNCGCGQDPCITYGKGDKKKGHNCASKVKHEEYGIGNCIKEMHTLDEDGNVSHYDVMFSNKIIKNVPSSSLEILEGHMHEHYVNEEKNKENFSPHKMIDPSTKKEYMADTYEQHKKYQKMGYVHEAKVDTVKYGTLNSPAKEKARNERKFGKLGWNQGGQSQLRKGVHWSKRGEKKVRGAKQIDEEGYDRWRDDRLVKYGIGHDGSDRKSTPSRRTPDNQKIKGKTVLQKETEKKYGKGKSALDIVRAKIQAKHGKGAIMDTKKKS